MSFKDITNGDTKNMSASPLVTDSLVVDFSRFYILTILYEGPQHGYSILSTFRERTGKGISPSLVYPFLRQLENKGCVTHSLKPVGAKKKKVFELTPHGLELSGPLTALFCKSLHNGRNKKLSLSR